MNSPEPTTKESSYNNGEEGIKVAIRMRPLNTKEVNAARVWRVLPKYNSVTQTTAAGKPLPERVSGRNFFTFDKVFGEDDTTTEVYTNIAQGIVKSAMEGLNGTIFAYGQTSSGKTHTMQGNGTIADFSDANQGGIVHMAARDIFSHIAEDRQRVFLIRVSFIEIYNEEVRDLLVSGKMENVLAIREDPLRGVFVNCNENIVTDLENLLGTLFAGEKKRAVASTSMNDRSSRSHTIFRITIESRKRSSFSRDDDESVRRGMSDDDSITTTESRRRKSLARDDDDTIDKLKEDFDEDAEVQISTLNLVDLAGSESVRLTGATGERQKEGGNINKSLLSLSRVIAALGTPNTTHVNYRDSKLTRILQPALSGNSRMAIICCATPSDLYLEETRSTLQFASRAKLVKTRAHVNVVLDDRSLIKKLQKELIEARKAASGVTASAQMRQLENEAARAEVSARNAKLVIERLKSSILKGEMFIGAKYHETTFSANDSSDSNDRHKKRRRFSDGDLRLKILCDQASDHQKSYSSPIKKVSSEPPIIMTVERSVRVKPPTALTLSSAEEISLLKESLIKKNQVVKDLLPQQEVLRHREEELVDQNYILDECNSQIDSLLADRRLLKQAHHDSESQLSNIRDKLEKVEDDVLNLNKTLQRLSIENKTLEQKFKDESANRVSLEEQILRISSQLEDVNAEKLRLSFDLEKALSEREVLASEKISILSESSGELKRTRERFEELSESNEKIKIELSEKIENLTKSSRDLESALSEEKNARLEESKMADKIVCRLKAVEEKNIQLTVENDDMIANLKMLTAAMALMKEECHKKDELIAELGEKANFSQTQMTDDISKMVSVNEALSAENCKLKGNYHLLSEKYNHLEENLCSVRHDYEQTSSGLEAAIKALDDERRMRSVDSDDIARLQLVVDELQRDRAAILTEKDSLAKRCDDLSGEINSLAQEIDAKVTEIDTLVCKTSDLQGTVESLGQQLYDAQRSLDTAAEGLSCSERKAEEQLREMREALDRSDASVAELRLALASHEAQRSVDSDDIVRLQLVVDELQRDRAAILTEKDSLAKRCDDLSDEINSLAQERNAKVTEIDALVCKTSDLQGTVESLGQQLYDAQRSLDTAAEGLSCSERKAEEQLREMREALDRSDRSVAELRLALASHEAQRSVDSDDIVRLQLVVDELQRDRAAILTEKDSLAKRCDDLSDEINSLAQERNAKVTEIDTLVCKTSDLQGTVESLGQQLYDAQRSLDAAAEGLSCSERKAEEQLREMREALDRSDASVAELRLALASSETLLEEERQTLLSVNRSLSANEFKLIETERRLDESYLQLSESTHARTSLRENLFTLSQETARLQQLLSEKDGLYEVECQKAADALRELAELTRSSAQKANCMDEASSAAASEIASLKEEVEELKVLLTSANEREKEAVTVALAADEELQAKEEELERTLRELAERDAAVRSAEETIKSLEYHSSSTGNQELNELLKDMEVLIEEKLELEKVLMQEKADRLLAEEESRQRIGEEQRLLIQEAENRISRFRSDLEETKRLLESAQLEAQLARHETESLLSKDRTRGDRIFELEALISNLKEELSSTRSSCSFFEQELSLLKDESEAFKLHANASKEAMKANFDNKTKLLREELESLKTSLHAAESGHSSYEQANKVLKEQLDSANAQLNKNRDAFNLEKESIVSRLKEDLALTKLKLNRCEIDLGKNQSENQALREHLQSLKSDYNSSKGNFEHENKQLQEKLMIEISRVSELTKLTREQEGKFKVTDGYMNEYNKKIAQLIEDAKAKDARISYLEAKKLTKDHLATIEKVQTDRMQLKRENDMLQTQRDELKAQVEALEKRLILSLSSSSTDSEKPDDHSKSSQQKDIINLKDRNHALEKKLKKYHSHCALLEEEKSAVLEVLKSCVPGVSSKDLNSAIIALCEKVNSLEEESTTYEELKQITSTRLQELERWKSKVTELEIKSAENENRISILSRSEKDLQTKLKYTREELLSFRKKHDDSERITLESDQDKSRQIAYLEKENLQLHKELKATKGLLRNAVNQASSIQLGLNDPMIDLQQLAACSPMKSLQAIKDTITNKSPETKSLQKKSPTHSARRRSMDYENRRDSIEKRGENDENTMECNPS